MRDGNKVVFEDRPAWREQSLGIIGLIVVCILLLIYTSVAFKYVAGLFVILGAAIALQRCMWHYLVTNDFIQSTQGILSKSTSTIRIADLRSVNVKQSILQRMLGTGDVEFGSAGSAGIEVVFKGVLSPNDLREDIYAIMKGEYAGRKCELDLDGIDKFKEIDKGSDDEICPDRGMGSGPGS